ncbi:polysaccharide pyruvyl transferase family protein [Oxynema sp. CENA135]|nr:polysaccharide pyruvyl transferase family protein [Oxynema sp. CENA135]
MKEMVFLIVGANFYNKGAQLMLLTTIASLKERYPQSRLCVSPTIGDPEKIRSLGVEILDFPLFHVGEGKRFVRYFKFGNILKFFSKLPRGTIQWKDVDVIVDISGFAFTDQWGVEPVKNLNLLLEGALKNKSKYIFLPQAFGPFEKEGMKTYMRQVIEKAELIFPRDRISYDYLIDVLDGSSNKNSDKIRVAPDITLTYGHHDRELKNYCCLIPNGRIFDQGQEVWGDRYEKAIDEAIAKTLEKTDLKIYVVVHDTGGTDSEIARQILEKHPSDRVELFEEENPLKLKEFLGQSQFIIGSRFHALASSLSCNVPSLGLGWSHKYMMLFENYNLADYSFIAPDDRIIDRLDTLLIPTERDKIRNQLKEIEQKIEQESEAMWSLIGEKL